jgi:hypothetical protein
MNKIFWVFDESKFNEPKKPKKIKKLRSQARCLGPMSWPREIVQPS